MHSTKQIQHIEKMARTNDGKCTSCGQVIKIYYYSLNKNHAHFMRAMADAVRNQDVNDVDISTLGLAYSVRSQVTKLRQHGLIARIKTPEGKQIPRRWLVTTKGWNFLNGKPVSQRVIVFNNQVLGHGAGLITIHKILGELPDPNGPQYEAEPVSPAEARTYSDVRKPRPTGKPVKITARYKGTLTAGNLKPKQVFDLELNKLQVGKPIYILSIDGKAATLTYPDIAAFQKQWEVIR